MSAGIERLRPGRAISWRTFLGLLLVPLTIAGVLLWGLWQPTERLEQVTAAVVNLDEPVELDGQTVPMGRVLAAALIGGDAKAADDAGDEPRNFSWLLTDADDAEAGLADGRYATVVTIPENFSAAATSASRGADAAETATIGIETSERGRLLDSALSGIVTSTATSVLNQQLGVQSVSSVFVGMTRLGAGIGEAAGGARQLADGGSQLADGAGELAAGTSELAAGTSELAGGIGELAGGIGRLSGGARELAGGAQELAAGAQEAATGGAQLATGVEGYVGGINQVLDGVIANAGETVEPLQQLRAIIELWPDDVPFPGEQTKTEVLATLDGLIAEATAAAAGSPDSQIVQLRDGGTALAQGVRASANGQQELASGLAAYAGGVAQLSGGVEQLAAGAGTAAAGAGQLAAGTVQLSDGAGQLADGARQAADGTSQLADGLDEAAAGVPSYTEAQAERMAETMVQPVEATGASDELFNAAGVPLFAGIALWAGALASFLVLAPLWRRTREAARGIGFVTLRSALPALAIGAAQGALAGAILPVALGYDLAQGLGFFGLAVVAGVSFALVNQGLSALLGGFGRFLSFALLAVAFAIGVISTAPPLLQAIGDASPIGALFTGFQAVATGAAGGGAAIWLLVLWGLGGLALTGIAVARARARNGAASR